MFYKRFKKVFVALMIGLLAVTILRERGIVTIGRTHSWQTSSHGIWNRPYKRQAPARVELVYEDDVVAWKHISDGEDVLRLEIMDMTTKWTPAQFVPFYKKGTSKLFIQFQIIWPGNRDGGAELIGFHYDSKVVGLCSSLQFRRRIRQHAYEAIVNTVAAKFSNNRNAQ